jgi:RimJ/RimL family protein N-acetyltransferase
VLVTHTIEIPTERLTLRPFEPADLEAFVAYRSDPEVARYQGWTSAFSMPDAERFLVDQQGIAFTQPGAWLQLAMVDRETGAVRGDCAVHTLDDQPGTTEVGVTLAPASHGSGYATEALGAVVAALFEQQAMHRVFANTDERNAPVHRLLERLGFRREGRMVEADRFKDEWTTVCVYALLAREWQARG